MTTTLDVLLIETEPYAGLHAATDLSAAGHRIHRCYPQRPSSGAREQGEPRLCAALTGGGCPIDGGAIDVAVVAGPAASGDTALTAAGVTCALRHDIPLVADDSCTTSFGRRFVRRANGAVVDACVHEAHDAHRDLRVDILRRIAPLCARERLDPNAVGVRFETDGPRLRITLEGPAVKRHVQQVMGVRVLDAIRSAGRVFGQVDVVYEATA